MSRTPAFRYEIIRENNTRKPQIARVFFDDGKTEEFMFGHYVSERQIIGTLPRVVMDSHKKYRKKVA